MGFPRFSGHFPVVFSPVVIIGALGSTALAANEFLLRSTLAVPRDERLAGWRSSSWENKKGSGTWIGDPNSCDWCLIDVLLMSWSLNLGYWCLNITVTKKLNSWERKKTNRLPKSEDDGRLAPVLDGCLKENGGRCCAWTCWKNVHLKTVPTAWLRLKTYQNSG